MLGRIAGDTKLNNKGLVTNYDEGGGATKRERGACEVLPMKRRGRKGSSHAEGIVFTRSLEVLAILKGELQKVSTL